MKKIRVFHIISHFDVGGAERVAINIASCKDASIEHHIVELLRGHSSFTDEIISELKDKGIRSHRSPLPVLIHWHYLFERIIALLFPMRMLLLWFRYHPDIIHTHTEMPDLALYSSLKLLPWMKVEVVRTIHNTQLWNGMKGTGRKVEKMMQRLNANISIAEGVSESYEKNYGQHVPIIYNGVALTPQKRYANLVEGKINILFAGRFEEQKGISTLIDIIQAMEDDERFHFHIFGSGTLKDILDSKLTGVKSVSINGPLHGLSAYMASFDYLIMPSLHEGLSILSIEASLNGLPVLINRCPGLVDTLPEDWPLGVNDNDLNKWKALLRQLPDIDRENTLSKAKAFASEHFSIEQMQKAYTAVYLQKQTKKKTR